jgi:predicted nucleic acid-binding protein
MLSRPTTRIVPFDDGLALEAADFALELGLAMADAAILATARRHRASIVTADADFAGLPDVTLIR